MSLTSSAGAFYANDIASHNPSGSLMRDGYKGQSGTELNKLSLYEIVEHHND